MKNYVWIVEMWNVRRKRWEPTVGVSLTKAASFRERVEWRLVNPDDRFRVVKYEAVK